MRNEMKKESRTFFMVWKLLHQRYKKCHEIISRPFAKNFAPLALNKNSINAELAKNARSAQRGHLRKFFAPLALK